jgi:hypothetical protein
MLVYNGFITDLILAPIPIGERVSVTGGLKMEMT